MNKKIGEAIDKLDAMGQPSEKEGIKWTKRFMDEFDKKEWEKNMLREEVLKRKRLTKKRYFEMLAGMANELFKESEISGGWRGIVYFTQKGMVMQIKSMMGRIFQRAFKPCGIPKIDLNAVYTLLGSAEDTMWQIDEKGNIDLKTKNGIYLK